MTNALIWAPKQVPDNSSCNWRHRLFPPVHLPIILLSCHDKVEKSLFVLASGVRWEGPERADTQTDIPTTNYNEWNTDGKLGSKHSQVAAEGTFLLVPEYGLQ